MNPTALDRALTIPRTSLILLLVLGTAQAIVLIALVLILRLVIETLAMPQTNVDVALGSVGALAVALLINALLRGLEFTVAERAGYEVVRNLRMTMYAHLAEMSPRQLQHRSHGALILRFTGDLTMLRTWISRGFARGVVALIVTASGAAILAVLDPWIALGFLSVLFAGTAASLSVGDRLRRTTRWVRRKRSLLTGNVDEQINSLSTIQTFARGGGESGRLSRQNDSMTRTLFREAGIRGFLRSVASATAWMSMVPVLAIGAIEMGRGATSLAVVITAATASRFLIGPIRDLGLSYEYWQRAKVSSKKIDDFLASRSMGPESSALGVLRARRGRVEFLDLHVEGALHGVTAVAEPGQVVAIVGPTGSGKSTLLEVLARNADPDSGTVLIDGQDVVACTRRSTRRQIGAVGPGLPLMRGTLRRNLTFRVPDAPDAEVARIIAAWELDAIFGTFPGGLGGWLTEGARNISGGQRQRLALARAFIGNPRILLLDEPTLHLDQVGRDLFWRILTRHAGTVFIVTHDPMEASLADQVWMMKDGVVASIVPGSGYAAALQRTAAGPHD
ncbi:MAG: ABC transporter ATP-binding protein [Propionibacteriaceae bacterium]|nr:ABC transporter ATP-binding protein [Propionibacteriaceae bacterium]